uniref:Cwf21 domain-containing protein n=1 Tax=Trichuris muris TaxID=70415 RepID=A0A5S6QT95_TRIMR
MYNGIGLPTARGSGTNAYVQRNLAFIAVSTKKVGYRTEDDLQRSEARLNKKPNPEILEHERKRKVELKCLELRDLMEGQGYAEEEVEEKVSLYRKLLLEQLAENPADFVIEYDAHGKAVYADGHHKTELMNEKNARLRRALKISDDYVPGAAFKGMCDPSKVMPGKIAPDSADCAANGPEAMAKKKEKECEDVSSLSDSSSDSESGSSDSSSSSSSDSDSSSDSSKSSSSSSSRGRLSRKSGRKRDLRSRKCSEPKARKTKHHSRRRHRLRHEITLTACRFSMGHQVLVVSQSMLYFKFPWKIFPLPQFCHDLNRRLSCVVAGFSSLLSLNKQTQPHSRLACIPTKFCRPTTCQRWLCNASSSLGKSPSSVRLNCNTTTPMVQQRAMAWRPSCVRLSSGQICALLDVTSPVRLSRMSGRL